MAGAIKGITIKLGADASELTKSLSQAEANLKGTQKQLNQVNKALKFNPNNVDLLRQKEELLTRKIEDTTKQIDTMKQALKQMDAQGIDKTSDEYMALEREIIQAESKQKHFNKELQQVRMQASSVGQLATKFEQVGGKLESLGNKMRQVSMVAGALAVAIGGLALKTSQTADDINTMSKVYGIATDDLQKYARASELVDVSVETIGKSQVRLKKQMLNASDGAGASAEAFNRLGVSVTNADGSLRNQDEVFQEVLQSLGSMQNETERDATAMTIFGKSASELNPLIEDMGETYKNVMDTFAKNDLTLVDQKTLDNANRFKDSLDMIKATLGQAFFTLGTNLASYLAPIMDKIADKVGKLAGWVAKLNPKVLAIIGTIAGVVGVLAPLLIGVGKMIGLVSKIIKSCQLLFGLLSANPIILVIAGVVALITALVTAYKKSEAFRNVVNKVWGALKSLVGGIVSVVSTIKNKLSSAFSTISDIGLNIVKGIGRGITNGISWIAGVIKSFTNSVKDKLKSFFGIASPSRWARDMIGLNIDKGMAEGIIGNAGIVNKAMASLVPSVTPTLSSVSNEMVNAVGTGMALANSGVSGGNYRITVELGGTKVAEKIFKLSEQGKMLMQG